MPRCGTVVSALSFELAAMPPIAAMHALTPSRAGEDPDLRFLADRADPERRDRLVADRATLSARHVQVAKMARSNRSRNPASVVVRCLSDCHRIGAPNGSGKADRRSHRAQEDHTER